jgi:hypothetical protein
MKTMPVSAAAAAVALLAAITVCSQDAPVPALPKATIDGTGPGWRELTLEDFVNVNGEADTWKQKDGVIYCTGLPIGVTRTAKQYNNFEIVLQWRHMKSAGNSGLFVWVPEDSVKDLKPGKLPKGIECQILDHGYMENVEKRTGKKPDWFTTNGDVFPVGVKMTAFPPTSPNKSRSFPRKNLSKGVGEWNHYYVRGINGEVRLWVNGEEVSGGTGCDPKSGYLCLESEGSPIEFKQIRIRELP